MITLNNDNYFVSNLFPGTITSGFGTVNSCELAAIKSITGLDPIEMLQVHGGSIRKVEENFENMQECDGLLTNREDIVLIVKTADCLPILFYDPTNNYVGAVHAGWKGTVARITEHMMQALQENGSNPGDIKVVIGPGIGACSYEIYGERLEIFKSEFPQWPDAYQNNTLNLLLLNYRQLTSQGINPQNIDYFPFCTACDSRRFYSYNRDKTSNRMYSYIALT